MLKWEKNICMIRETAGKYPQENYAMVVRAIQSEYIFLQRVKKKHKICIIRSGEASPGNVLPCFFFGKLKYLPPIIVTLGTVQVKKSGPGLQNPVTSDYEKFLIQQRASLEFIRATMVER